MGFAMLLIMPLLIWVLFAKGVYWDKLAGDPTSSTTPKEEKQSAKSKKGRELPDKKTGVSNLPPLSLKRAFADVNEARRIDEAKRQ